MSFIYLPITGARRRRLRRRPGLISARRRRGNGTRVSVTVAGETASGRLSTGTAEVRGQTIATGKCAVRQPTSVDVPTMLRACGKTSSVSDHTVR